ncbi:MAG: Rieske 2Fe-2S domain-containing protein [Archangiaceae bacterium]|nr:Rieske 2Fe-2S domain-containing protein [Archangiaceae bacterium]
MTRVLASAELPEGARRLVVVGGRAVAVVRVQGAVYAVDDVCPHRGGSLAMGDLQGFHLYCPLHAWCFDVRTGDAFFPQGCRVQTFEVVERDGEIYLGA